MRSLSDQIDALTRNAKNIKTTARLCANDDGLSGAFTCAVLYNHLGDLIRDVDPSELGLFTLVQTGGNSSDEATTSSALALERINFTSATPLRRATTRQRDSSKGKDIDPEVYAAAAIKYMDRYKLVRPMPRAQSQAQTILDRVSSIRQSIEDLQDRLQSLVQTRPLEGPGIKAQLENEERQIQELRSKLKFLSSKRLALEKAKRSHLEIDGKKSLVANLVTKSYRTDEEDDFWNTPGPSTRTLRFTDNLLMDENVDFGDTSNSSFSASPAATKLSVIRPLETSKPYEDLLVSASPIELKHDMPNSRNAEEFPPTHESEHGENSDLLSDKFSDRLVQNLDPGQMVQRSPPQLHVPTSRQSPERTSGVTITKQVDIIMAKVWTVLNDLIIVAAAIKKSRLVGTPSTREMIDYLEHIVQINPVDNFLANDNTPSSQQILTAALILALLSSRPTYSLPLSKVKEILALRLTDGENTAPSMQLNASRVVYGCVAKRLVKIDRTVRGQVVSFDV